MKKQIFSFLLSISLLISVSAQQTKQSPPKPDLTEQNLRRHVTYLASDKLEGRRTGERGATFAAGYVANMFSNFKLKGGFAQTTNGKTKTSFLQPFPLVSNVALEGENRLMVTTPTSNALYNPQAEWTPLGASPNANIPSTDAVFVGYGIASGEPKYDDYAGKNVAGKVVYAFDGTPDAGNPHSLLARFNVHAKAKIAKEKGALALVLISRETKFEDDKLTLLNYDPALGETAIPVAVVSRKAGFQMLGESSEEGLQNAENQARRETAEGAPADAKRPQVKIQLKANLAKKSADAYNVIGILEGTDFALKNEAVIIGAHYDHLGRGGQGSLTANSTEIHHGADDNASGVAGLLELARQFAAEKKNKRTIIFIAFGGEEEGLLGSKFYVNNPVFPIARTVAMINMDMVGRLKDNKLTIGGIGTAGEWKSLVETENTEIGGVAQLNSTQLPATATVTSEGVAGAAAGVVLAKMPQFNLQLNEDGFGPSDHSSFYGKQIPVLFFFTGTHAEYHKPTDTADKINYIGLSQITSFVLEIVKTIDQNPKRPTYTVAKSSGMAGGRTGFSVSLGTVPSYADSSDGLVLDGVREASPAAKAGLKAGDKIVSLAGREVRNVSDYTVVLGEMKPDVEYEIVILRGAEKLTLKIVPAARK